MPPEVRAELANSLGIWPLPQSTRDGAVDTVAKQMGLSAGYLALRHGTIPEPEASRAAEAEAFAAASAYAAGKDLLATEAGRFEVFQTYIRELWTRACRYAKSRARPQAAGASTSRRAGLGAAAALPPPPGASSVAYVAGICSGASDAAALEE